MNHLDEELRRALGREEPPAGFAERVLASLPAAPANVVTLPVRRRPPSRFILAAAAALAAVATGSIWLAIPRGNIESAPAPIAAVPLTPGGEVATAPLHTAPIGEVVPGGDAPTSVLVAGGSHITRPRTRTRRRVEHPIQENDDAEALRAAAQLRLALHIAGDKLNVARREVHETVAVPES